MRLKENYTLVVFESNVIQPVDVQGNGERGTQDNISLKTSRFPKSFCLKVNWRFFRRKRKISINRFLSGFILNETTIF